MFDLIIVGGGPIGLACAIEAQKKGLRYLILEKGALVNSIFNYPLYMTFFSTAERLEIGEAPFTCLAPKPGRPEAVEYYRKVTESFKLNIRLFEAVEKVEKEAGETFRITTAKGMYTTAKVIIATGFYDIPVYMGIPGEDLPQVRHYYKEPHEYAFQNVLVVGASNSSVDAALETWRKGAKVTLVARGPGVGPRVKYWVKPDIENRIAEGSITAHFNTSVQAIRPGEVDLLTPDGVLTITNDFVLALTGYRPNFDWLQQCGITFSDDGLCKPVYNPDTMETNVPGLYLAGVVCGGMETHKWFIENSRVHAQIIIRDITSGS